jgi:hypothetical protein
VSHRSGQSIGHAIHASEGHKQQLSLTWDNSTHVLLQRHWAGVTRWLRWASWRPSGGSRACRARAAATQGRSPRCTTCSQLPSLHLPELLYIPGHMHPHIAQASSGHALAA